jgi:hypothetical protein
VGTIKWFTPHDPNFGEEVLGYLQEGLCDDSESEYTIESDHNMECAEAATKPRSLSIAGFHSKKHFDCFFAYYTKTRYELSDFATCTDFIMEE